MARRNGKIFFTGNSGFPKSHDISKAIDKMAGAERRVVGIRKHPTLKDSNKIEESANAAHGENVWARQWNITAPATPEAQMWEHWGTALKPAFEPIILARKPISEKNIAENVLKWGTGGINIDDCRVEYNGAVKTCSRKSDGIKDHTNPSGWKEVNRTPNRPATPTEAGRWPANFIHDGSEEVLRLFPKTKPSVRNKLSDNRQNMNKSMFIDGRRGPENSYDDSGSAARFFYCAKASRKERGESNNHPTVKPIKLMEYLVKLITPPNGIVLDPF
jgi:site-specific DNA-methyltransferase (adenine-specific)